ncbi:hypothetical protein K504DRAFT_367530 [Pleomassaria siparia CBS 279.74]|uniref:BTB domain-containing protein n=1 Tax=Pleomassaria siparia CBS 279.74 TaxID=1314801 RepID=A0A6G1KND1_9PLEO|nr:hypothetical protein K504DRAFT_367530 [Pleomassaria siparia CBS 279.74]
MNQPEDVEVIIAHDRRYKFHASVLARNSVLFAEMLTEANAAQLSNKAKQAGIKTRWMIELVALPSAEEPGGRLKRALSYAGVVLNENGRAPTHVCEYYESILYAFYNTEITIDDEDMRDVLYNTEKMLNIAEYLGCVPLIAKTIDVALVKHGQLMFQSIAAQPVGWIKLGLRIKSELIFKEAMIHLVGNYNRLKKNPESTVALRGLPSAVRNLTNHYHQGLVKKARHLEVQLITAYPGHMMMPSDDLPIKREHYAKEILVWMALSFFRHWFGQKIIYEKGSNCDDGGFELYTTIGRAGEAYMDKSIINQFHTKAPMTKKAMNVLENHLLEIKECMKGHVEKSGILKNKCQLDVHRHGVEWLTCVEVDRNDFPWVRDEEPTTGQKRGRRKGGNEIVQMNLREAQRMREEQLQRKEYEIFRTEGDEEDDGDEDEDEGL